MILRQLDIEQSQYNTSFQSFRSRFPLPEEWFAFPDHFAIKCANEPDYQLTCEELSQEVNSNGIWEIEMDNRLLGSAKLAGAVTLGGYDFQWVEIMQPRPGKETDSGFVEHTEFLFPNFEEILSTLKELGIEAELQKNPGHSWINVVIDSMGREIKFNDKLLEDVAEDEQRQGKLHKRT